MNKQQRHEAIRARASAALADLYHNATPSYGREMYGRSSDYYEQWFRDVADWEVEYIRDGGSTPGDYRACLAHPANGGKLKTERARAYYVRKGLQDRDMERADCGVLTGWRTLEYAVMKHGGKCGGKTRARLYALRRQYPGMTRHNAQWERISEYGELYQWGRGGRTLAPDGLYSDRRTPYDVEQHSIVALVDLIRVVESFNGHVAAWCASVPEQWREHCEEQDREAKAERNAAAARKRIETRERAYWAARGVMTTTTGA